MMRSFLPPSAILLVGLAALVTVPATAEDEALNTSQPIAFFESKVRPLLAEHCFQCHGPQKQKAGLRLDSRQTILNGGDSGPAIVVDKPEDSLLLEAVNYQSLEMPPKGKLSDQQIAVLRDWIKMGAPWPQDRPVRPAADDGVFQISEEDRNYWAFRPIRRPSTPQVKYSQWAESPIDAFILKRLEDRGLRPNPPADRRRLVRRAFFDLIGLPPTPEEVRRFVADDSPEAFEQLIGELLERDQYGERWGRHWLDVARFGQTNGYERDDEKLEAWRYRDYVVKSFNEDKPFDRFVLEQLAGDELDDISYDSIIATGFYRLGLWDDEPAEKELALYDELDDVVRATGTAFLGLSIGCARCHRHMFDPISQQDYYEFLAFFRNIAPYGRDKGGASETHWETNPDAVFTPLATIDQIRQWKRQQKETRAKIDAINEQISNLSEASAQEEKTQLTAQLKQLKQSLDERPFPQALSVREQAAEPPPTHLFIRGNPKTKGAVVEPRILAVLGGSAETPAIGRGPFADGPLRQGLAENGIQRTSGRRRAVAQWIASANNPLTARVLVNRIWQHLFDRGIVRTPNNFGRAGVRPTHPKLLDWLAQELIDGGWKIKPLIKKIMLSNVYQMSSRADNDRATAIDPANDLFWRHNMRRLEAEAVRDSILAVSGQLNLKMGGRGFFPELSADVLATQSKPGHNWGQSSESERNRRSVYIFVKRTLMVPMMEAFDYTNTAEPLGVRPVTTVAPQALMLLNDRFVEQQAAAFADRVISKAGDDQQAQVIRTFELALARPPSQRELSIGQEMLQRRTANGARSTTGTSDMNNIQRDALKSFCLAILNLNEFIYID